MKVDREIRMVCSFYVLDCPLFTSISDFDPFCICAMGAAVKDSVRLCFGVPLILPYANDREALHTAQLLQGVFSRLLVARFFL
jgi:hypothetical protein